MSSSSAYGVVPALAELFDFEDMDQIESKVNDLNQTTQRGDEYVKEMEAMIDRTKLNYEKNTTHDLYHKLHSQISHYKKKVYDEESTLRLVPDSGILYSD